VAVSSLTMVPGACGRLISAPLALLKTSANHSSVSTRLSRETGTETLCSVSPAAKSSVPLNAVKSLPAVAVPSTVA
jgi:hypothetical protein